MTEYRRRELAAIVARHAGAVDAAVLGCTELPPALRPGEGPTPPGVTAILPHGGDLFQEKVVAAVRTFNGFGKALGFEQIRELLHSVAKITVDLEI